MTYLDTDPSIAINLDALAGGDPVPIHTWLTNQALAIILDQLRNSGAWVSLIQAQITTARAGMGADYDSARITSIAESYITRMDAALAGIDQAELVDGITTEPFEPTWDEQRQNHTDRRTAFEQIRDNPTEHTGGP